MAGRQRPLAGVLTRAGGLARWVLDALFPDFCGGCGREGTIACASCWAAIPILPDSQKLGDLTVWSVTRFPEPVVRGVVHALKYGRRTEARERMEEALGRWPASGTLRASPWRLVPVPMHGARERRRGRNHARVLAEMLAAAGMGTVADVLVRTRRTRSQTALDRATRAGNVAGAFAARGTLDPSASYLLVDDVVTSGATLQAAAAVITGAGARRVAAWTFAAD